MTSKSNTKQKNIFKTPKKLHSKEKKVFGKNCDIILFLYIFFKQIIIKNIEKNEGALKIFDNLPYYCTEKFSWQLNFEFLKRNISTKHALYLA